MADTGGPTTTPTPAPTPTPTPTPAPDKLTIEDIINLYKIKKSIDRINIKIGEQINIDAINKYTECICIITINIFENYICKIYGKDIINDSHKANILNDYDTVKDTLDKFNNSDKTTYYIYYVFLTNAKNFNIVNIKDNNNVEIFIITIQQCIEDIISLITYNNVVINFDIENIKKISNIIDDYINFDFEMLNNTLENIKKNILCKYVFKNIYDLILSIIDNNFIDINSIKNGVITELEQLFNCNFKLLANIIYNAYLNHKTIDDIKKNIKCKLDIIKNINSLNQFKEIDTIPKQYDDKNTKYNLNYIAYSRTKQYIKYNKKTDEINFNIPKNYLDWLSNSCYMDVIVFSLLYKKNKFIYDNLLKKSFENYYILNNEINNEINVLYNKLLNKLDEIYIYIHNKNKLKLLNVGDKNSNDELRNILNNIHLILNSENYYISISNKLEYVELNLEENKLIGIDTSKEYNIHNFVILLFTILQLNDLTTIKKKDNTLYHDITVNIPKNTTYISPDSFKDYNNDNLIIVKSKLLVLNNQNNKSIYDKLKYDKVYPPPYLKLEYNTELIYLQSIILHYDMGSNSGHYTCLFNNNTIWYEYNDLIFNSDKDHIPPYIGTLDDIIKDPNYNEHIIMLIYY
jgi:hypothetical protein